jgi:hypothetical protein
MSLFDALVNAIAGVAPPIWSASGNPLAFRFDDPVSVSADWLARQQSDAKARTKGTFETTAEYRQRLAATKAKSDVVHAQLACTFLLQLDRDGASYDADSRTAVLRSHFTCAMGDEMKNSLELGEVENTTGQYTLKNQFGAEVEARSYTTTSYFFQISNFRALAALRKGSRDDERLEGAFVLEREYARSELNHLRLGARVRVVDVKHNDGYSYGGDDIAVPDTHRKAWVTLRGTVGAIDVINTRTFQHLGGWQLQGGL